MLIVLNPKAGGHRARDRWEAFRSTLQPREAGAALVVLGPRTPVDTVVSEALSRGERRFVAAGGDGTVNALLNALMEHRRDPAFGDVALGAIGLGSSNDFHKASGGSPAPLPSRTDFGRVRRQDVGCLDLDEARGRARRYFLVNASVGVSAEGNAIFNHSHGFIPRLKQCGTGIGIAAAALSAIARHADLEAVLSIDGTPERSASVSNLAILKSPGIGGAMRAPAQASADDGRFGFWLEEGLTRAGLLGLFFQLLAGRVTPGAGTTIRRCTAVRVRARAPFLVEYDGETVSAQDVTFSVLRGAIGVCP